MHGRFERPDSKDRSIFRRIGPGFLMLSVCVVIALVALVIIQPPTSNWVAEAVQAEFVDGIVPPGEALTQLAQPAPEPRNMTAGWLNAIRTAYRGQR